MKSQFSKEEYSRAKYDEEVFTKIYLGKQDMLAKMKDRYVEKYSHLDPAEIEEALIWGLSKALKFYDIEKSTGAFNAYARKCMAFEVAKVVNASENAKRTFNRNIISLEDVMSDQEKLAELEALGVADSELSAKLDKLRADIALKSESLAANVEDLEAARAQNAKLDAERLFSLFNDKEKTVISGVIVGKKFETIAQELGTTRGTVSDFLVRFRRRITGFLRDITVVHRLVEAGKDFEAIDAEYKFTDKRKAQNLLKMYDYLYAGGERPENARVIYNARSGYGRGNGEVAKTASENEE